MKSEDAKKIVNDKYEELKKEYLIERKQCLKEQLCLTGASLIGGGAITSGVLYLCTQKHPSLNNYIIGSFASLVIILGPSLFYKIMKNKYDNNYIDIKQEKKLLETIKKELEINKNRLSNVEEKDFDVAIKKLINNH